MGWSRHPRQRRGQGSVPRLGYYLATALSRLAPCSRQRSTVASRIEGPARVAAGYTVSVGMLLAVAALVRPPTGPVRAAGSPRVRCPSLLVVASLLLLLDLFARKLCVRI